MMSRKALAQVQRQLSIRSFSKTTLGSGCQGKVLAIRREETSVWERRAPLNPNQVQTLVSDGAKVLASQLAQPPNLSNYKAWVL